jgi:hypothetical protein
MARTQAVGSRPRKIVLAMNGDTEFHIAQEVFKKYMKRLCALDGHNFQDSFDQALDDWMEEMGLDVEMAVDHDDLRVKIKLSESEYAKWCEHVSSTWRGALIHNTTGTLDIAELVSAGIDAALEFIGVSVTEEKADKPAEKPKRSGGRFAVEVNGLRIPPRKASKRKGGKPAAAPAAAALNGKNHGHVNGLAANGAAAH